MKEILEILKQQPKEVLQWVVFELMASGKLSFALRKNRLITPNGISNMKANEGSNCLGCSLIICVVLIIIVYLITHIRITMI